MLSVFGRIFVYLLCLSVCCIPICLSRYALFPPHVIDAVGLNYTATWEKSALPSVTWVSVCVVFVYICLSIRVILFVYIYYNYFISRIARYVLLHSKLYIYFSICILYIVIPVAIPESTNTIPPLILFF
jgi:hypothetical protein